LGGYGVVASSFLVSGGCQPQAGEGYTGEPLFSIQGKVVLNEPSASELVPALRFSGSDEHTIVDAEIRGDFPARFRLDVMEAPPESVLFAAPAEDEENYVGPRWKGLLGLAAIVLVPREHPRTIPVLQNEFDSPACFDDQPVCIENVESCTADGRCRQRTLECFQEQCPLIDSRSAPAGNYSARMSCFGKTCVSFVQSCDFPGEDCTREIRKCDLDRTSATTTIRWHGVYEHCTVTSESGDTSLSELEHVEVGALGYTVIYLTEPNDLFGLGWLEPGYHLVESVRPTDEAWVARLHCEADAASAAVNAYNQAHGTSFTVYTADLDLLEPEIERLKSECPEAGEFRLVKAPLEHELTLTLGRDGAGS
jgi:hypothetical protein